MAEQVKVRLKGSDVEGTCPVNALPHWEARGYEAVDSDEVKAARETDGITTTDVKEAEKAAEAATAGESAETTDKAKTTRGGRSA